MFNGTFAPMNIRLVRCWLIFPMLLAAVPLARGQKVGTDKKGRLFFTDAAGKRSLVPVKGQSSEANLDPAKRRIVFVRATPGRTISTGSGDAEATELCLVDPDGKNLTVLVAGKDDEEVSRVLASFQTPQFSPDGKTIYFVSAAWATSGSVQAYELATKAVRFVCAGSVLEVVPNGDYAGDLLVQQHRYFLGGGSYDWFWLMGPDGKEIGVVGETTETFKDTYFDSAKK